MRSAAAIILAIFAVVVVVLVAVALTSEREQAFTLGVSRSVALELPPADHFCQSPISVPPDAGFDAVAIAAPLGTPAPRAARRDRARGRCRRAARAAQCSPAEAGRRLRRACAHGDHRACGGESHDRCLHRQPRPPGGARLRQCRRRRARQQRVQPRQADGVRPRARVPARQPRSFAALLPAVFERDALFRARWVGAWTYWVLALLCVVAVPLLLVGALRSAVRDSSGV